MVRIPVDVHFDLTLPPPGLAVFLSIRDYSEAAAKEAPPALYPGQNLEVLAQRRGILAPVVSVKIAGAGIEFIAQRVYDVVEEHFAFHGRFVGHDDFEPLAKGHGYPAIK